MISYILLAVAMDNRGWILFQNMIKVRGAGALNFVSVNNYKYLVA